MGHDFVGGHELDSPNAGRLFNIVFGLGGLTFLSLVTCVQLFNVHREALMDERGKRGSYLLNDYRAEMAKARNEAGETVPEVTNSEPQFRLKNIPLAEARANVLKNPQLLKAGPPPPGWIHPDDLAGGAAAPAAPPPVPAPGPGVVSPAGTAPTGAPPAGAPPAGVTPSAPAGGTVTPSAPTPAPPPTKAAPAPTKAAPAPTH